MNRKKNIFILLNLCICTLSYSQVGVNNTNPQQALHISGTGSGSSQPLIQIDGLSAAQNPAHENAASSKRVYRNTDGDLVILSNNQSNITYTSSQIPTIAIPAGTETAVTTYSFTLEYPSSVYFEARPTLYIDSPSSSEAIRRNGQARQIGFYFKFTSAPAGVTINKGFGNTYISRTTYSASDDDQFSGDYVFNPKKELFLPKGSYTVVLYAFIQNSDVGFITNDSDQATQNMRVSITPVTY